MIDVIVILRFPVVRIVDFSVADPGNIILAFERIFQKHKYMIIGHFRKTALICFFDLVTGLYFSVQYLFHFAA